MLVGTMNAIARGAGDLCGKALLIIIVKRAPFAALKDERRNQGKGLMGVPDGIAFEVGGGGEGGEKKDKKLHREGKAVTVKSGSRPIRE